MHTLFLEIQAERDWSLASIGPAYIAGMLRKNGYKASLLSIPLDQDLEEVARQVLTLNPDLIGCSLTTRQWLRAKEVLGAIRQRSPIPIITGGLHPTFAPERVLATPAVDFVCLGEGEEALLDLVRELEKNPDSRPKTIPNIWAKGGTRPRLRPPFEPIDSLPRMARDMLAEVHGVVHMVTQRGCPFPCTYCGARKFHDLYRGVGSYGRRRSHESVLQEIRDLQRTQPVHYITFLDDTFTLAPSWIERFRETYGTEMRLPFSIHARAETVNPIMLERLAKAGCKHITYGVESGSELLRTNVLKRVVTNDHLESIFRQTRELGIMVTANYIIGIPGETRDNLEETLALHHRLKPDDFGYFVFYPYPGTSLFHTCQKEGYLPDNFWELPANHRETVLQLPTLRAEDITEFYDRLTQIRQQEYLAKHGHWLNAQTEADATRSIQDSACIG